MKQIKVLVLRVGEPAQIVEIENSLAAMQKAVNGYIEMVRLPFTDSANASLPNVCMTCNEEGMLHDLPINFYSLAHQQPIFGDIFFTRINEAGENVSLTSDDCNRLLKLIAFYKLR